MPCSFSQSVNYDFTSLSGSQKNKNLVELMNEAVEEVCGLESGRVAYLWMTGHEREVNEKREEIERLISERNKHERINARRRLRVQRGGGELARLERELIAVKEQLERAKWNMRCF